jgi:hypothetical protein
MEKGFIKKVRYSKLKQIFTIEQEVLYRGIKINEVRCSHPQYNFQYNNVVNKILETSIHIENDNYNINP